MMPTTMMRTTALLFLTCLLAGCATTRQAPDAVAAMSSGDVPETKHHVPVLAPVTKPTRDADDAADRVDLDQVTQRILSRAGKVGFDGLSREERNVAAVWGVEADVANGAFDQYFFNASGDLASAAPEALRDIGAPQAAAIVEEAVRAFGADGPASDQTDRQWQLARLGSPARRQWAELDRKFSACPDDLPTLLEAYVAENAEAFQ